jgi:hypothetical protein
MTPSRPRSRPRRYRALYRGVLRLTKYRRAQTETILRLERAGATRDVIAEKTGVPYNSIDYVAELHHLDYEEEN